MKNFFKLEKYHIIGLIISSILLIINIIFSKTLGYRTNHKYIYDSSSYIIALVLIYLAYLIRLFVTKKKSSSDLAIIIYLFFLVWEISFKAGLIKNDLLIPSPEGLFDVYRTDKKYIFENIYKSLQLLFFGYLIAITSGTILGIIAGWFQRVREVLLPISNAITLIPPLLFSAYLILMLKDFKLAAIGVIFFAVFWPTFQGMIKRVSTIDKSVIDAARVMGVSNFKMLYKVIVPFCLPEIISSISKSLRGAFMCLAGAEMLGINGGIGFYTETYKAYADYRRVLAGIVAIGIITTLIDIFVSFLQKNLIKWRNENVL